MWGQCPPPPPPPTTENIMERASKYVICQLQGVVFSCNPYHICVWGKGTLQLTWHSEEKIYENLCCSVFPSMTILFQVKGMGHEMDWNFRDMHAIYISRPKKGPWQVFKIFRCSSSRNLFLVNAYSSPLDFVIIVLLVKILFLLIGQGSRLLLCICWKNWPIFSYLILVRHQKQANRLSLLANCTPHLISDGCKIGG